MSKSSIVEQPEINVYGISIRTTNEQEMSGEGKIGDLWQRFYTDIMPNLDNDALVYGVYHDYEADATGAFSLLAGSNKKINATEMLTLAAGRYRHFSANGEMPQTVISLWQQIWQYYTDNPQETRAFSTDYEHYLRDNQVSIYIALAD